MACHFRQMSSWILSAAFLTSSLVSSLNLPEKDRSVTARHLYGTGGRIQCGPYYGEPDPADCAAVTYDIDAFREHETLFTYDEFIIRGGEGQHDECELHWQTPLYWRRGPYTCDCSNLGFSVQIC